MKREASSEFTCELQLISTNKYFSQHTSHTFTQLQLEFLVIKSKTNGFNFKKLKY